MCNKEKFWPVLCEMIGRPELGNDPSFRTFKERLANRDKITTLLDDVLSSRTTAEWLEHFAGRVPAAPVNDVASALDNPFVREGGRVWDIDHPERSDFQMVAAPYVCPGETLPRKAAPALGQDTERLLTECGLSREHVADLRQRGVI
jgi:crotonobetainyl-CoA:carnitine CoA-transferase CaiB-like acyl-CoA transferase